ncbi:MAG: hypothetical protein AAFV62_00610 [Pseudomonadota bacterium]
MAVKDRKDRQDPPSNDPKARHAQRGADRQVTDRSRLDLKRLNPRAHTPETVAEALALRHEALLAALDKAGREAEAETLKRVFEPERQGHEPLPVDPVTARVMRRMATAQPEPTLTTPTARIGSGRPGTSRGPSTSVPLADAVLDVHAALEAGAVRSLSRRLLTLRHSAQAEARKGDGRSLSEQLQALPLAIRREGRLPAYVLSLLAAEDPAAVSVLLGRAALRGDGEAMALERKLLPGPPVAADRARAAGKALILCDGDAEAALWRSAAKADEDDADIVSLASLVDRLGGAPSTEVAGFAARLSAAGRVAVERMVRASGAEPVQLDAFEASYRHAISAWLTAVETLLEELTVVPRSVRCVLGPARLGEAVAALAPEAFGRDGAVSPGASPRASPGMAGLGGVAAFPLDMPQSLRPRWTGAKARSVLRRCYQASALGGDDALSWEVVLLRAVDGEINAFLAGAPSLIRRAAPLLSEPLRLSLLEWLAAHPPNAAGEPRALLPQAQQIVFLAAANDPRLARRAASLGTTARALGADATVVLAHADGVSWAPPGSEISSLPVRTDLAVAEVIAAADMLVLTAPEWLPEARSRGAALAVFADDWPDRTLADLSEAGGLVLRDLDPRAVSGLAGPLVTPAVGFSAGSSVGPSVDPMESPPSHDPARPAPSIGEQYRGEHRFDGRGRAD